MSVTSNMSVYCVVEFVSSKLERTQVISQDGTHDVFVWTALIKHGALVIALRTVAHMQVARPHLCKLALLNNLRPPCM